jgi:hypothetical protein
MSKYPTKVGNPMFGVERTRCGEDGKPIFNSQTRKVVKDKVQMSNAQLPDGSPQSLYFPQGHPCAGIFKGMAILLQERGYHNTESIHTECPGF